MKRKNNWFIIVIIILLLIPSLNFFIPIKVGENPLSKDTISSNSIEKIVDGSFQREFSSYYSDRLFMHNQMIWLKTKLDLWSGRNESNGVYIADNMLIEKPTLPSNAACSEYARNVEFVAKKTKKKVFSLILPTSKQINKSELSPSTPATDEVSLIAHINQDMGQYINQLDGSSPLASNKGKNGYYATDPRLSSYGAFLIYYSNIKQMGFTPISLREFNVQYGKKDYYGSLYSRTFYTGIKPDKINLYYYSNNDSKISVDSYDKDKVIHKDELFDTSALTSNQSIYALAGEDAAVKVININNESSKSIVVFGDDNFDPFLQFFSLHYSKITVVNLKRLTENLKDVIKLDEADQILFSYGITTLTSTSYFNNINMIFN